MIAPALAGLDAEQASEGETLPDLLHIDGMPLAEYVAQRYPPAAQDPLYIPIAQSRAWLCRRSGLSAL